MNTLAPLIASEQAVIEHEREQRLIESLDRVCQRVGRVLTNSRLDVRSVRGSQRAPAWISGSNITFAYDEITSMTNGDATDRAMVTNCLLFHELGHYRFDAKLNNPIWRKAEAAQRANGAFNKGSHHQALNILTDQRHELMTAVLYPKARDYFAVATTRGMSMVLKKYGGIPAENYLLYYGRRHILPRKIIEGLRKRFVGKYDEATVAKSEALIDEFLPLTLSDEDVERMWHVALELSALLPQPQSEDCLGSGVTGSGSSKTLTKKASEGAKKQMQDSDEADEAAEAKAPEAVDEDADAGALADEGDEDEGDEVEVVSVQKDKGDDADDAEGDDADDAEGDDADDAGEDAEGDDAGEDAEGDDADGDADEDADADDEDEGSEGGNGSGGEKNGVEPDDELAEAIKDAEVKAGEAVAKDLLPYIEAMRRALDDDKATGDALTKSVLEEAKRLTSMFERVNSDLGMVDMRGLRSGRLDVRRAVSALARNDVGGRVFRKRAEDLTDDTAMGVFIAIDASGSMSTQVGIAQDAALALALGAAGARHMTKIIAFDSTDPYDVLKGWFGQRYQRTPLIMGGSHYGGVHSHGGGTPFTPFLGRLAPELAALYEAEKIRHSAVFIVTDGGHDERADVVREAMRGITKQHASHIFVVGIGCKPPKYDEVDAVVSINNVNELGAVMQRLLGDLAKSIAHDLAEGR